MRTGRAAVAVVIAAVLTAGCGSGSDAPDAGKGKGGAAPDRKAEPLAAFGVPEAWDGGRGWDQSLPWVPMHAPTPVAVVPGAAAVAVLDVGAGYTVQVRSAADGKAVWTSADWTPPTPLPAADKHELVPWVLGVEQDGQKFVVLAAHGLAGKDELHEGTEVVRLALYPAAAKGQGVKPVREIDVPLKADPGEVRVQAEGGRLIVARGGPGAYPRVASAVDLVKGTVAAYDNPHTLLPECEGSPSCSARVMAVGPAGPLVHLEPGFGVPGRWSSDTVRPEGVPSKAGPYEKRNGQVYGVAGGKLLVQWDNEPKAGAATVPTWSVHDMESGRMLARTECGYKETHSMTGRGYRNHDVVTSPAGRFLAAGPVAFDLERKQGVCLAGDGNRKEIAVRSVRDDGTAYGLVKTDDVKDGRPAAQLDLTSATGDAKALGAGVETPDHTDLGGAALFVIRDQNQNLRISVRQGK
ncbi:hypothetical protein OG625_08535 [Streptomyces sp. NBC_01351]|uniref:hypothetical protein n=1 Tax=Streptomyces sp. NBC_01351 TaxID=2903833 RepID=UPI002E30D88A|nr:hypothetical protein [Streptomyces sp. NBC_01351]